MLSTIDLIDHWGLTLTLTLTLTLKDASYHWCLSLNNSLLLPQLSLPFSKLQPKEAKRRACVPILLYRSASAQTVRKIESAEVMSSYETVDSELHADDYTGVSSCRPIVHVEAMITQYWWHPTKVLADEILADCSQNRQSTKIKSPPKFPAIRYII